MRVYKRRKHISWIVIVFAWIFAFAMADQDLGWVGFVGAGLLTVFKLLGAWSGDYEDNDWEEL